MCNHKRGWRMFLVDPSSTCFSTCDFHAQSATFDDFLTIDDTSFAVVILPSAKSSRFFEQVHKWQWLLWSNQTQVVKSSGSCCGSQLAELQLLVERLDESRWAGVSLTVNVGFRSRWATNRLKTHSLDQPTFLPSVQKRLAEAEAAETTARAAVEASAGENQKQSAALAEAKKEGAKIKKEWGKAKEALEAKAAALAAAEATGAEAEAAMKDIEQRLATTAKAAEEVIPPPREAIAMLLQLLQLPNLLKNLKSFKVLKP
eukprot:1192644-Prorocentrum_minimum.AAC.2